MIWSCVYPGFSFGVLLLLFFSLKSPFALQQHIVALRHTLRSYGPMHWIWVSVSNRDGVTTLFFTKLLQRQGTSGTVLRCSDFQIPLLYTSQKSLQYFKLYISIESLPRVKHVFSGSTVYSPIVIHHPLMISAKYSIQIQNNLFIGKAKSSKFKICIQHAYPLPPQLIIPSLQPENDTIRIRV